MFDAKKVKNEIVDWLREWEECNGKGCNFIVGISGGKDSSVVAALLVEAFGKDRVIGVKMPCGEQSDIEYSDMLINHLGIKSYTMNIYDAVSGIIQQFSPEISVSSQTITNLPARVRMATLYAISQSLNGRVANTCNLSENWVGYCSKFGDSAGDFSPLENLTATEVKAIGRELGLPSVLVDKIPTDGLCGKTDEDNLGFTYDVLDRYIRTGEIDDLNIKAKIDSMHEKNLFKLRPMDAFEYQKYVF
jgi:NAD+ synthase